MSSSAPFTRISMHVGDDSHTMCMAYTDSPPILDIRNGAASIGIVIAGQNVDDTALTFARDLLRCAQKFAGEVERLHAEQAAVAELRQAADKAA